jgi:hypothetical protein
MVMLMVDGPPMKIYGKAAGGGRLGGLILFVCVFVESVEDMCVGIRSCCSTTFAVHKPCR